MIRLIEVLDTVADAIDAGRGDLVRYEISRLCREVKPACYGTRLDASNILKGNCADCEVFDWCSNGVKG